MDKRRLRLTTILAGARLVAIVGGVSLIAGCAVSEDGTPSALAADPAPAAAQEQTAETATGSEPTAAPEAADEAAALTDAATQTAADQTPEAETETETASAEATGEISATAEPTPELVESSQATTEVAAVTEDATSAEAPEAADAETTETEASAVTALAETQEEPETTSVFARLFSAKKSDTQAATTTTPPASSQETAEIVVEDEPEAADPDTDAAEIAATDGTTTASIDAAPQRASLEVAGDSAAPLPGVREVRSLYQIASRESFDYRSFAEDNGTIEVASAAGLAGLAGGRLAVQHEKVDVACLKPALRATLKRIESHFGRQLVVTSGYRSRSHNRRVGGAPESRHMACEAADIKIAGVSKWQIAEYARAMPGRGGVGTYCHTDAVHVDVGPKRDWNWRCARRRK